MSKRHRAPALLLAPLFFLLLAGPTAPMAGAQEIVVNPLPAQRIPIAVADGIGRDGADAQVGVEIGRTLRRCFEIALIFEVTAPPTFLPGLAQEGLAVGETNFDGWFNSGAEVLVKAAYVRDGANLRLDLRLYDVLKNQEIKLSYTPPATSGDNFKPAVYAFANAVIKHFTGNDGFFGQQILAVRKSKRGGAAHVVSLYTDGTGITQISSGSGINILPAWGPNGAILYTSYDRDNPDLIMASGSERKTLSSHSGLNTGAAYCPGNGRIALTLSKDDNAEIYTMKADGSDLRRLTDNSWIDTSPAWSPDCSRIAFVSNRGGSAQIYVMNADGSGARALTTAGRYNTSPAWSRKGGKIAFTARDEYNSFDLFVLDLETGNVERLTQDQGNNEEASWSPDGNYLVFTSTRDGGSRLFIMTADGRYQAPITDAGGFETPAWSW